MSDTISILEQRYDNGLTAGERSTASRGLTMDHDAFWSSYLGEKCKEKIAKSLVGPEGKASEIRKFFNDAILTSEPHFRLIVSFIDSATMTVKQQYEVIEPCDNVECRDDLYKPKPQTN
jgi:hypothetical protein